MKTRIIVAVIALAVVVYGNACSDSFKNDLPAETPPDYGFYKQIGSVSKPSSGTANLNDECASVATDSQGNIFCGGRTSSGPGQANAGTEDLVVMKFDSNGGLLWVRQMGTALVEGCNGIAVDSNGDVICAGSTAGDLAGTMSSTSGTDAFVLKLNGNSGATIWIRQINEMDTDYASLVDVDSQVDVCNDVDVDSDDNIICVGHTLGDLFETRAGSQNGIVIKMDGSDGAPIWTKQYGNTTNVGGTNGDETFSKVHIDTDGAILVGGSTAGNFAETNAGLRDAFVLKLTSAGVLTWAKQFGTITKATGGDNSGTEELTGVSSDSSSNVFVSMTTTGNMAEAGDSQDIVIAKMATASGALTWMTQLGQITTYGETGANDGNDTCSVGVNSVDEVFCAGNTTSSMGETRASASADAIIMKFTADGQIEWLHQWGLKTKAPDGSNTGAEVMYDIAFVGTEGLVTGGYTSGDFAEVNSGGRDILVIKMSTEGRTPPAF